MFKRKQPNKAKLEHKLYLARENPEPVFDLTDCELYEVPSGIYSLCRVFLKQSLKLENNNLHSLNGGGNLKDLHLLKTLNLSNNSFHELPVGIAFLTNLQELYLSNNQLKKLCDNICLLKNLKILDLSNNHLKALPNDLGNLENLRICRINNNKIRMLPKSIHKWKKIRVLELDTVLYEYPPENIVTQGLKSVMTFICNDVGVPYTVVDEDGDEELETNTSTANDSTDSVQQKKIKEFLEIERRNEILSRQELEYANASKVQRDKLLAIITQQQDHIDNKLYKLHQEKEFDRFKLIEQLQEAENTADIAIKQLLVISREPLGQLLEQERLEEEKLLSAINRHNETLRKEDVLTAMQEILAQEALKFKEFNQNRMEASKSILEQETEIDYKLLEVLQNQDEHKIELVNKLIVDNNLQKAAVATLLERGDARSWGLLQQIRFVESQLAALTRLEIDRKKLQMDDHLNDLCDKRCTLSVLLVDLLEQQKQRRAQLISTLHMIEESNIESEEDFWLRQYQRLLDKLPEGLSHAQKNIDPLLAQCLLFNGVIHCLPFLANLTQCQKKIQFITDEDLLNAGVLCGNERLKILDAFQMYENRQEVCGNVNDTCATAPPQPTEEASAPVPENIKTVNSDECVICLDMECEIIFVPCGHLCCCGKCAVPIKDCPLCRGSIERKITLVL